ncbi:uncharacterized protein LOC119186383 isoform X2 [Rhipicephalus microplus]|uniref:uncharacterized protein LOC119186383 isoform X2 n=1 Tax=Rhipicephalus microplus TaxID=6941 RepID=UPI003F6A6B0B
MKQLLCVIYIAIMWWTRCDGQYDLGMLPQHVKNWLNYTREILKNKTPIVVMKGSYEAQNHPACEQTVFLPNKSDPGFHHNLTHRMITQRPHIMLGPWNKRDTFFFVGTAQMVPIVDINARFVNQTLDSGVSGMFSLLFANNKCFVLKSPNGTKDFSGSCTLWVQESSNSSIPEACDIAFFCNCTGYGAYNYTYNKTMCQYADIC